jgi:hypothetical protein
MWFEGESHESFSDYQPDPLSHKPYRESRHLSKFRKHGGISKYGILESQR